MGRERGWVSVSVRTYHSHRSQQQQQNQSRVMQQDYTVDESGATLNAVSRSSDASEEQRLQQMACGQFERPFHFDIYPRLEGEATTRRDHLKTAGPEAAGSLPAPHAFSSLHSPLRLPCRVPRRLPAGAAPRPSARYVVLPAESITCKRKLLLLLPASGAPYVA